MSKIEWNAISILPAEGAVASFFSAGAVVSVFPNKLRLGAAGRREAQEEKGSS
jgi:hypothetical protein